METIRVPEKNVPVLYDVDVCVVGGGSAGVATAASAARNGANTLLIERLPHLGGTTTNAMVCIWHLSDGRKQVCAGVAQDLVGEYAAIDPDSMQVMPGYPDDMGDTVDKSHEFRNEIMKHAMERYVVRAGAVPLYYTDVHDVVMDGDRIEALIIGTKRGNAAVRAKFFADCTGDGDVAVLAGAPYEQGRSEDGLVQGMTMMFELGNIDKEKAAAYPMGSEKMQAVLADMAAKRDAGQLPQFGPINFPYYAAGGFANMNPASGDPTDLSELTRHTITTRANIFEYMNYYRQNVPGFERVQLVQSGDAIGIRESRRIMGQYVFSGDDVVGERRFDDAIGHGFWCVDIHDPKGTGSTTWEQTGNTKYWLKAGHNYQIPFRILQPQKVSNLLVVGRCVSATHEGIASLRLQSHIMVMGQAAGTAFAQCVAEGKQLSQLDIRALRRTLVAQGAYIEGVA